MDALDKRLTEMEVRLTFIDDTVQSLVDTDARQLARIATLERSMRDLRSELATLRLEQAGDSHSERPPHY